MLRRHLLPHTHSSSSLPVKFSASSCFAVLPFSSSHSFATQQKSKPSSASAAKQKPTTHFSFGGKQRGIEKKRDKKDFRDLFEYEGTVAKDSTIEEGRWALWRLFWAKPIDHLDDTELGEKKAYERKHSMKGYYGSLLEEGESLMAKKSKEDSRWNYIRQNLGGLFTLQMFLEIFITFVAYILLELELISGKRIHDWWNYTMPSVLAADFASAESAAKESMTVPVLGITLSPVQQNHLHTAHAIGMWSIPLQLLAGWAVYPMLSARWNANQTVLKMREMTKRAMEEAEREKKRPKFGV